MRIYEIAAQNRHCDVFISPQWRALRPCTLPVATLTHAVASRGCSAAPVEPAAQQELCERAAPGMVLPRTLYA
jgi:hypothetical protein